MTADERIYFPGVIYRVANVLEIRFSDLPGCTASGKSVEECLANAEDILAMHLAREASDGRTIPLPRSIADALVLSAAHENYIGFVAAVLVPAPRHWGGQAAITAAAPFGK